jgi:hypothetical protein
LLAVKSIDKEFNAGISFMFFSFIRTAGSALIIFGIAFLQLQSEAMMGILLFITSLFVLILLTILKYTNLNLPRQ